jgi:hypothetical protein
MTEYTEQLVGHWQMYFCITCRVCFHEFAKSMFFLQITRGFAPICRFSLVRSLFAQLLCITLLPLTLTLTAQLLPTALHTLLQTVYACLRR